MKKRKQEILGFFRNKATHPLTFSELNHVFGITRKERADFKKAVEELVVAGELIKTRGQSYALPIRLDLVIGRLSSHRDGYGFVTPEEGGEDIFIPARYLRGNMHGDRVAVRIESVRGQGKTEGRIVRTLERGCSTVVGRFEASKNFGYVVPDEHRINYDIYIPPSAYGKAMSGQVVVAEITAYPAVQRNPEGRIVEVLGWPDDPEVEAKTILTKYELPHVFSTAALAEARAFSQTITAADLAGRVDLRGNPTVTIDGETARDFDDAVAVKRESDGIVRLWVSIADVSHYVKPGSYLDQEAYARGTSVYFPDRCIPMLPEELSTGICSLNPQVERLTMTAEMLFDSCGEMMEAFFYPSVIRSDARLTYTIVKEILGSDEQEIIQEHAAYVADLGIMKELALRLMERRRKRGSIDFDLPEPEIVLDMQGQTEAILKAERNIAHRLIEEFMLAANEAVALHITQHAVPSLYRVHEHPDAVKLLDFREFISNFGYEFKVSEGRVEPRDLQRLLEQVEGKPEEKMLNKVLLRCMKQARYSVENLGHFGLAAPCYTHFTSPIRRYPDLVVHRILKGVVKKTIKQRHIDQFAATLPETADHTSKRERVAMEAEREIVELKKLQFMQDKVGEEFDGFITGVSSFGFFVELVDFFVEGLVHLSTLLQDFYHYIEKQHSLVGENTRETFRIGDSVRVKLANVSLEKKQIDFVLAVSESSHGRGAKKRARETPGTIVSKKTAGKGASSARNTASGGKTGTKPKRSGPVNKRRHKR
jgi:ribonuclease R